MIKSKMVRGALAAIASLSPLLYSSAMPGTALAEGSVEADRISITTPVYKPAFNEFNPPLGTYVYETSWQGIPAAEASVKVEQLEEYYRITTSVKTYSGIDLFYKLRYRAEGTLTRDELLPVHTVIDQKENSRERRTEINFREDGLITTVRTQKGERKELTFDPKNFTLDPFAAAFLARSLSWNVGDVREFDTFNGKSRYLIKLTAAEKTKMKVNGQLKDVFVIVPTVRKLTEKHEHNKLRECKIYVTADSSRDILQIVSEVFIGSVTTKLESFAPLPALNGTRIAHHKPAQRVFFE